MTDTPTREDLIAEIAELKKELKNARLSEELLKTLADTSFEGLGLFDDSFHCFANNKTAQKLFGYNKEEFSGMHALDFIAPESHEQVRANLSQKHTVPYEAIAIRKDGTVFPALLQGTNINFRGKNVRVTAVRDISEINEKQLELEVAHAELESIFENSMVGMLLLRGGRKIHRANQRIADILGYDTPDEMVGISAREFHLSQERFEEFGKRFFTALVDRDLSQIDYQFRRKDGSAVWCTMCGKAIDTSQPPDLTKGVLWVADDITKRKEAEKLLIELATTDELTGACNRRHFIEIGQNEFARKKRYKKHDLSLLMLDLDHFKDINDTLGHSAGDKALKAFTMLSQSCLREVDSLGRLGGEEFAIILPDTNEKQAAVVADRICQIVKHASHAQDTDIPEMTVSIGLSIAQGGNDTLDDLLKRADHALYKAKDNGRDRVEIYREDAQ